MTIAIYLDTNVFIGACETAGYASQEIWHLFAKFWRGDLIGVTIEVTLAELLPKPLKLGQFELIEAYKQFLAPGTPPICVIPIFREILVAAAAVRGSDASAKLPAAIHWAPAQSRGCSVVLSGDRRLPPLPHAASMRLGSECLADIDRLTA